MLNPLIQEVPQVRDWNHLRRRYRLSMNTEKLFQQHPPWSQHHPEVQSRLGREPQPPVLPQDRQLHQLTLQLDPSILRIGPVSTSTAA